jgi:hypothetical protein
MSGHPTIKRGSFLYDGTVRCRVEIVQTDFLPGSGDYEDPPEIRDDVHGIFYEIHYRSARTTKEPSSIVHGFKTVKDAVNHVESAVKGIQWE